MPGLAAAKRGRVALQLRPSSKTKNSKYHPIVLGVRFSGLLVTNRTLQAARAAEKEEALAAERAQAQKEKDAEIEALRAKAPREHSQGPLQQRQTTQAEG